MKYKVYKLVLDDKVVYVGITKRTLNERKEDGYIHTGCNYILKDAKIELIEETNNKDRERYWIEYYSNLGNKLYNKTIINRNVSIGKVSSYKSDDYNIIEKLVKLNKK